MEQNKVQKLIKEYEEYAKQNGFSLNNDKLIVERVIKGLLENEKKYGKKYCPCRRISGNPEVDDKIICPCDFHLKEIKERRQCVCGLFTS